MGKINAGRVLLGGLLAGVVINLFEFVVNEFVLGDRWAAAMAALNKTMPTGAGPSVIFICWGFLIGILAVWVYAAVRPRFGAGARTAIRVGLMLWLLIYVQAMVYPAVVHLFPRRLIAIGLVQGLVEIVLATLLGAWLYKEEAAT